MTGGGVYMDGQDRQDGGRGWIAACAGMTGEMGGGGDDGAGEVFTWMGRMDRMGEGVDCGLRRNDG